LDGLGCFSIFLFVFLIIVSIFVDKHNDYYKIYTKTFLVGSLMAIFKGILDSVTIIPDSIGWNECKKRISNNDIIFLKNLNFSSDFSESVIKLLYVEIFGINGHHIRYCGDMMLSGHTYFVVLFNLGNYKILNTLIPNVTQTQKIIIITIIVMIIIFEFIIIELKKFHYTVDIILAIIIVLLTWNCKCISFISNKWNNLYLNACDEDKKYLGFDKIESYLCV
jgi:hypothetical protein